MRWEAKLKITVASPESVPIHLNNCGFDAFGSDLSPTSGFLEKIPNG